jgi:hypothetical protein
MALTVVVAMAVVLLAKTALGLIRHIRARNMVQVVPNLQVEQEGMLGMVMALQPIR